MHHRRVVAISMIGALLGLLFAPGVSLAHERRTLAGKYDVVVGWETEPAYVGQRNAAGIRISKVGTNPAEAITGAEKTLRVAIRQGGQTRTFDLRAVFGQPGYYVTDIVPTRAGDYVWTFSGSIGADQVNETFDSADGKFDAVVASSGVEFPIAAPDPDQVRTELQAAHSAAQTAQAIAYLGVAVGVLGLLVAVVALLARPRSAGAGAGARRAVGQRYP